jgi:Condensation domain
MADRRVPASIGQRLLWFLDRHRGAGGALNCPMVCEVRGPLDPVALARAVTALSTRHEALRTTLSGQGRNLTQVIHDPRAVQVTTVDAGTVDEARQGLATELRTRVDPAQWPLRVTRWRLGAEEHHVCLNMHHSVTDSWSCGVLFRELAVLYERALGSKVELAPVGWQYAQFTAWQDRQFKSGRFDRHVAYWKDQLDGLDPPRLPFGDVADDTVVRRESAHAMVGDEVGRRLRELARANNTTVFAAMLAVFYVLLQRRTGRRDLAVATVFANRTRPEVEGTAGFLANLVALRARLPEEATFTDVVTECRATVVDAFAHQEVPFHVLPRTGGPATTARLDDIVFQMLAEPIDLAIKAGGSEFRGLVPDVVGRFDFELALMPCDDGFAVKLYYTTGRVDPSWARGFVAEYVSIAASVRTGPKPI